MSIRDKKVEDMTLAEILLCFLILYLLIAVIFWAVDFLTSYLIDGDVDYTDTAGLLVPLIGGLYPRKIEGRPKNFAFESVIYVVFVSLLHWGTQWIRALLFNINFNPYLPLVDVGIFLLALGIIVGLTRVRN